MIDLKEVKRIATAKSKDHLILTVYLNTDRRYNPRDEYLTIFKDMSREILKELKEDDKERNKFLEKDIKKIDDYLKYDFSKKARGLFIFSCYAENIWKVIELPIPVFNQYFLAHTPYINPLLRILDDYEKFCVLLVDKEKARIFTVYLNEIVEHLEIFDEIVGKHRQGGSSEARFQRHHEDEVHRHLKRTSRILFKFFKKQNFDRLIIGYTTSELWPLLESCLHPWLKQKIVAKFHAEMFASQKTILNKVLPLSMKIEREKEAEIFNLLKENLGPRKRAVSGLENTLFELQEGKVQLLIINRNFKDKGRECLNCGYLDSWDQKFCPLCGSQMRPLKNVVEKAIKKALTENIKVEFIQNKKLTELGNIGAILRF